MQHLLYKSLTGALALTGCASLIVSGELNIIFLLPGLASGGIVTKDQNVRVHGTPSEPEGIFRLNDETFRRIGEGIVNNMSGIGIGDTNVNIEINNPVLPDEAAIDRLIEGIEDSFNQTQRGLGFAGATA